MMAESARIDKVCEGGCGKMNELTHIDLFSGIGGFALAARWAGIKTVQFVEIDPFCQKVLQKNFPGVNIHDDIKTFTNSKSNGLQERGVAQHGNEGGQSAGDNDTAPFLLTGGFPCQPFSCAGKRRGKEDDRYLWEEMLRVIKEFKPTWIIGENVNGIRSMEFKDGLSELEGDSTFQEDGNGDYTNVLDGICDSLEAIGYEVQPLIIPACAVNAPHRRDRVWIVANSRSERTECFLSTNDKNKGRRAASRTEHSGSDCHAPDTEHDQTARHGQDGGRVLPFTEPIRPDNGNQWEQDWYSVALRTCVRRVDDGLPRKLDGIMKETDQRKCAKQETIAIIENGDDVFIGSNWCENPQKECPRKDIPTGVGYELCKDICQQPNHAEIDVLLKAGSKANGGTLYLIGHYYLCDPCKTAAENAGIKNIIIVKHNKDRVNRLKALGNSVVPQIPYLIMKAILEVK